MNARSYGQSLRRYPFLPYLVLLLLLHSPRPLSPLQFRYLRHLGVINACLPVMKPVFSKVGQSSIFSSISTWRSSRASGKPRSNHISASGGARQISKPRQITHRPSHMMFSPEFLESADSQGSSPAGPSSRFHLPASKWRIGALEIEKGSRVNMTTDWAGDDSSSDERVRTRPSRLSSNLTINKW